MQIAVGANNFISDSCEMYTINKSEKKALRLPAVGNVTRLYIKG
jgi:hypothetical protein